MTGRRLMTTTVMILLLAGCAHGRVVDGTFISDDWDFSVVLPKPPFEQIPPGGTVVAVSDPETGASVVVSAHPDTRAGDEGKEVPLRFLARELFVSIEKKEYSISREATIDGVPAWHVEIKGVSDGVPLVFSAYVTRFSGAIYDIVFWSRPEDFERASGVFLEMVNGFRFQRGAAE